VKPFYSGRIASKLMEKHTSLLTKTPLLSINSTLIGENGKVTKWRPNTIPRSKKSDFIWSKTTGFRRKY
jgi:hypothetical protein